MKHRANNEQGGPSGEPLGTHSNRKLASTHTRRSGATKDERDIRGRWKGKARVADVYDDVELPWSDVNIVLMLAIGGPCRYMLQNKVTDQFVLTHVVPNIRKKYDDATAVIFGTALLYSIFCVDNDFNTPASICSRVRNAYRSEEYDVNIPPVRRIPIVCTGHEGEIYIDDVVTVAQLQAQGNEGTATANEASQDNRGPSQGLSDRPLRDQIRAIHSQLHSIKSSIQEIYKRFENNHTNEIRHLQSISSNIAYWSISRKTYSKASHSSSSKSSSKLICSSKDSP